MYRSINRKKTGNESLPVFFMISLDYSVLNFLYLKYAEMIKAINAATV